MFEMTDKDILSNKLVAPGYYDVVITDASEGLSKDGNSTNYRLEGEIIRASDSGSDVFAGVPTPYWNFNSKAKGMAAPFLEAIGINTKEKIRFEWRDLKNKKLSVFIGNKQLEGGRTVNQIMDGQYKAAKSE